jgi:hypothetical protein
MSVELSAERPWITNSQTYLHLSIPPDTIGAVSAEQQVTMTNSIVRVFDRGRRLLGEDWLRDWWNDRRPGDPSSYDRTYFDPRICYDPFAQRWYVYASSHTDYDTRENSSAHLAVSLTKDFLGSWRVWDVTTGDLGSSYGTKWFDQPRMGFGAGMVAVSITMHQRSGSAGEPPSGTTDSKLGTTLIVLSDISNQPGGLQGNLSLFPGTFPYSNSGVPFPATTLTNTSRLYLVSLHNYSSGIYALSALRKDGSSVVIDKHFATVDAIGGFTILSPPAASGGGHAPQQGSSTKLEANFGIIENAVYRSGSLWFTQCVYGRKAAADLPSAFAHWMRVGVTPANPAPQVLGEGLVGAPGTWIIYPGICANKHNDALLGYTLTGPSIYPSAGYSFRYGTDAANTMRDGRTYSAGQSFHYETGSGTRNRWGDYSATVIDPSDDEALMTLQEYSPTDSPDPPALSDWDEYPDRYALMWARTGGAPVPEVTSQPISQTVAPGGSATFTFGAGFDDGALRQWYLNGQAIGGPSLSSSITVNNIDAGDLGNYQCKLTSASGLVLWSNVANLKLTTGNPGIFNLSNFGPDGDGYYEATEQPPQFVFLQRRISVTRTVGFDGEVNVRVRFRDPNPSSAQRAHDGWDFTAKEVILTFLPAGPHTQIVYIPTINDTMVESDAERFTVEIEIADSSAAAIGEWDQATILIDDNDTAPTLATAVDYAGVPWNSTTWKGQTTSSSDGVDAAQVDWSDPNTNNDLSATFTGPGTVLFDWRMLPVSLGGRLATGDSLRVLVDGITQETYDASRGTPWAAQAVDFASGSHTVIWRFHRGTAAETAQKKATAFLDKVYYFTGSAGVIEWAATDVTFNEAAGTAQLNVKRWGAPAAGNFSVTVFPVSATGADFTAPSTPFTMAAGATSAAVSIPLTNDPAAEPLEHFIATLTLPVGSPLKIGPDASVTVRIADDDAGTYGAWRVANFTAAEAANDAISGPLANPDNDELPNVLEFAFEGLPKSAASAPMPVAGVREFGGLTYTTLTFRRPKIIKGTNYTVQRSGDAALWEDGASYGPLSDTVITPATSEILRTGDPVETITVQDNTPKESAARAYLRMVVTLQP